MPGEDGHNYLPRNKSQWKKTLGNDSEETQRNTKVENVWLTSVGLICQIRWRSSTYSRHVFLPSELFEGKPFLKPNPSRLPKDAYSFPPTPVRQVRSRLKGIRAAVSRNLERRERRKAAALPSRVRTGEVTACRNLPAHLSFSEPEPTRGRFSRTFLKRDVRF